VKKYDVYMFDKKVLRLEADYFVRDSTEYQFCVRKPGVPEDSELLAPGEWETAALFARHAVQGIVVVGDVA